MQNYIQDYFKSVRPYSLLPLFSMAQRQTPHSPPLSVRLFFSSSNDINNVFLLPVLSLHRLRGYSTWKSCSVYIVFSCILGVYKINYKIGVLFLSVLLYCSVITVLNVRWNCKCVFHLYPPRVRIIISPTSY